MYKKEFINNTTWGWLPILAPLAAAGLLLTSLAVRANISSQPDAMLLFWIGILIIIIPVAARMLSQAIEFREALALAILAGEMLFLVSAQISNIQSGYDALLHWRTASDVLTTRHLFTFNSLLPVSSYYPGLEIVTTALINLTGLSIFGAGYVVIFVARLIMVTSLFLILCELSGSVRAAGLGSLIYMGSSTFVFFDTQFAYESLSLPLAALVIWLVLKRSQRAYHQRKVWVFLAIAVGLMVAITHHLMSYFLTGYLILWTVVALIKNYRGVKAYVPLAVTFAMLFFVLAWLGIVAEVTVGYLAPYVRETLAILLRFISGYRGNRSVLATGQPAGVFVERLVAIASVLLLLMGEALGLWVWWKSIARNKNLKSALGIVLVTTSLIYPLLPVLHLNNSTWEVSDRLASFIFIGLAFVIGLGLTESGRHLVNGARGLVNTRLFQTGLNLRRWAAVPALTVVICAGIIGGSNPATRLPGPYMVEADSRSVDAYGMSAAAWAVTHLGANQRMASDRIQSVLMGTLGQQAMQFGGTNGINISPIFLKPTLGASEIHAIQALDLRYLVIDERVTQAPPLFGYYFESWEQQVAPSRVPVDPAVLDKFNHMPGVSLIYDNGSIRIYDMGGLVNHVP